MITSILQAYGVNGKLIGETDSPSLKTYKIELELGQRASFLFRLEKDLSAALRKPCRIYGPKDGAFFIEMPQDKHSSLSIESILSYMDLNHDLPVVLGKDNKNNVLSFDLASLPHLLIAGQTGSGKSVCLNSIIRCLTFSRKDLGFVLIDPKQVEFKEHENNPKLALPVCTETYQAMRILDWLINDMEARYSIMEKVGAKNLNEYNKSAAKPWSRIVVIIDEIADLMMSSKMEAEEKIVRLAQKARAAGIHLILGTQRPTANVVTGLIKANVPGRIAFAVASKVDSRVILDQSGAEALMGKGDGLFLNPKNRDLIRFQGAM